MKRTVFLSVLVVIALTAGVKMGTVRSATAAVGLLDALPDGTAVAVIDFQKMGSVVAQVHPTHDHFLPLLYCLGLKTDKDEVRGFNENFQWPAVSMRSIVIS